MMRSATIILGFLIRASIQTENSLPFPHDFLFGAATSSYQIEGGWNADGKGENIWDHLFHTRRDIVNGTNGDVADDSYHNYKRDVQMMRELGLNSYRFSLSWTRILPNGKPTRISRAGVKYYNNLINEMLKYNITPIVTLFHWDTPQGFGALGSFYNKNMTIWFQDYARVAFTLFGDRVKYWITINEPGSICNQGITYFTPVAPGINEYICAKAVAIVHAATYRMYVKEFKQKQKGMCGLTIAVDWFEPLTNSTADQEAAELKRQATWGMYAHPIFSQEGGFPKELSERVAAKSLQQGYNTSRMPEFTEEEKAFVLGTYDFFGMNHYTAIMVSATEYKSNNSVPSCEDDIDVGTYIPPEWPRSAASWLVQAPNSLLNAAKNVKETFNFNPIFFIFENGWATASTDGLYDLGRVNYYRAFLQNLNDAIYDGINIKGYMAWTLMDNFEWFGGYAIRFGLYEVDFNDRSRRRTPRYSAFVYKDLTSKRYIDYSYNIEPSALPMNLSISDS